MDWSRFRGLCALEPSFYDRTKVADFAQWIAKHNEDRAELRSALVRAKTRR